MENNWVPWPILEICCTLWPLKAKTNKSGSVRIIAGEWRGRRLPVPDLPGLRPSGDRARETLFSWLQPHLRQAHCLDLFAGTGVLGLEAISRGAAQAVLVEKSRAAAAALRENVKKLSSDEPGRRVIVVEGDALLWLNTVPPAACDLVFLDPPFGQGLAGPALHALLSGRILRPDGLVYLETARTEEIELPSEAWDALRDKTLGEVRMRLLQLLE
jgi:16S rRNA (guanine966-N2)-methyltransferase